MSEKSSNNGKAFISYSRKDKEFVKKLEAGLEESGVVTWVDWEGIPLSADWMAEITAAIESADAFLFVISPDSLASKVCGDELELGLKYNKKLVPILFRPPEKDQPMHAKIAATNWVYLREQDDFNATMPKLVETINTDLGWIRQHTRLLERAVEWDGKKRNGSFLLNGTDLEDAERWMAEASGKENREVIPLQAEYIRASRQQAVKRQRMLLTGVSFALVISVFLAVAAIFQRGEAMRNAELAANNASTAQASEKLAKSNAELAANNASTAVANEQLAKANELRANDNAVLAQNNASTAVANELARATQQAIAIENEQLAKESERRAIAQRSGAQAQLVQQQPSQLFASTLLALYSLDISPSQIGEEVLRQNLSLMAIPRATFQQGGAVSSIRFSPDGKLILSAGANSTAYIWDASSSEKVAELAHEADVNIAIFSPDGQLIATGSADGTARLWHADGSPIALTAPSENNASVTDADFSPDSQLLAVGREDGNVTVVEISTGKVIRTLPNSGKIYDVVFSANGKRLAVTTSAGQATVWNPVTGTSYVSIQQSGDVYQAAFSPDTIYLVTASRDQTAQVIDIVSGLGVSEVQHDDWVEAVAYSPDGSSFATASDDNTVRVWEAKTWRETLRLRHDGFVQYVTYDPQGWYLASSSVDGTARVWDPTSGVEMLRLPLDGKGGMLQFSPDSSSLVTSNEAGELHVWDLSQLDSLLVSLENDQLVRSVKFSPDGKWLVSGTDDSLVRLWDMDGILNFVFGDGEYADNTAKSKLQTPIYTMPNGFIRSLFFNPITPTLGILSETSIATVNLNDPRDFSGHTFAKTYFTRGTYQRDGNLIAIASSDSETIGLYDPATQKFVKQLSQPGGAYSVSYNRQYPNLLAAGGNGAVWIWDVSKDTQLTTAAQPGTIMDVDFSPDGQWLASGSDDGGLDLWKVTYDGARLTLDKAFELSSGEAITDLEFAPDNTRLATASEDGLVRIWDVMNGSEVARLRHPLAVKRVSFSSDGQYLATASGKLIFLWDVLAIPTFNTSDLVTEACKRLTRNLTAEEWATLGLQGERQSICPNFP
jgi:WD40 repeat protein